MDHSVAYYVELAPRTHELACVRVFLSSGGVGDITVPDAAAIAWLGCAAASGSMMRPLDKSAYLASYAILSFEMRPPSNTELPHLLYRRFRHDLLPSWFQRVHVPHERVRGWLLGRGMVRRPTGVWQFPTQTYRLEETGS